MTKAITIQSGLPNSFWSRMLWERRATLKIVYKEKDHSIRHLMNCSLEKSLIYITLRIFGSLVHAANTSKFLRMKDGAKL